MKIEPKSRVAHEAVGVFNRSEDFQDAIDELLSSGFHRAELSLLASERAVQEKLGHRYKKASELQDDPRVPRTAYVSTEAIGGAEGGLIGALVYVGATAAAGAIVVSGGTLAGVIAAMKLAGDWWSDWYSPGPIDWRSSCPPSPRVDGSRKKTPNMGAYSRYRKEKRTTDIAKMVCARSRPLERLSPALYRRTQEECFTARRNSQTRPGTRLFYEIFC